MTTNFKMMFEQHLQSEVKRFVLNSDDPGTSSIRLEDNFDPGYLNLLVARLEKVGWMVHLAGKDLRGYNLEKHFKFILDRILNGDGSPYTWEFDPNEMRMEWLYALRKKLEENGCNISAAGGGEPKKRFWTITLGEDAIKMMEE